MGASSYFIPATFYWSAFTKWAVMYLCIRGYLCFLYLLIFYSILYFVCFRLVCPKFVYFEHVPTVWYVLIFILLDNFQANNTCNNFICQRFLALTWFIRYIYFFWNLEFLNNIIYQSWSKSHLDLHRLPISGYYI